MAEETWDAVQREFWRLYQSGAYAEALDLVMRHEDLFPRRGRFYNWKMCMAARVGNIPLALQTLQEAVDTGLWFSHASLREDEDLVPLQGLPEFERLAAICEERYAAALAQATPQLLMVESEHASPPYPLLLALHGNNSNSETSVEYWRSAVDRGWLLALPQSSQLGDFDAYVWNDREQAIAEVREHSSAIQREYAIDLARVVVGGFSMGGGLAVWLAVSGAIEARGFIAVGPYLEDVALLGPLLAGRPGRKLRGYIVVGDQDHPCYQISQEIAALLQSHDIACELEVHPNLGHVFPPAFDDSLAKGLDFILQE
jgi:predicted esterase